MQKARNAMSGLFTASMLANRKFGGVLLSHGECHTIIGAKAFHGPVRDGKAWDHLAMATRHKLSTNLKKLCTPDTVWNTELIRLGL